MYKRILSILGANIFGQLCTILIQFLGVPLYLHCWGAPVYGEWLVIIAIPFYLAITGTGVSFVTGNKMQMLIASDKPKEALSAFQSSWVLITGLSLALLAIVIPIIVFFPVAHWLNVTHIASADVKMSLGILCLYVLFSLQSELFTGVYRAGGKFARGIFILNLLRVIEFACVMSIIFFGADIIQVSLAYLSVRAAGVLWMLFDLRKLEWFSISFKHASLVEIRSELKPILSFLGIPLAQAFVLQGMVAVVGIRLGPAAVVTFTIVRTLVNLIKQFASIINNAILPEFSTSITTGNLNVAKSLHRLAFQITLAFSLLCTLGLYIFSDWIFLIWTGGKIKIDHEFFLLMLLSTIPYTLYNMSSFIPMSINRFSTISTLSLIMAILSTTLTYILAPHWQLMAVPIVFMVAETTTFVIIVTRSLKIVQDPVKEFFVHIFSTIPYKALPMKRILKLKT